MELNCGGKVYANWRACSIEVIEFVTAGLTKKLVGGVGKILLAGYGACGSRVTHNQACGSDQAGNDPQRCST